MSDDRPQHSPGEWTVSESRGGNSFLIYPDPICLGDHIAQVHRGSLVRLPVKTVRANARVMAAGPKLLAACKAALAMLVEEGNPFAGGDCELGAMLNEAIRKAEGTAR